MEKKQIEKLEELVELSPITSNGLPTFDDRETRDLELLEIIKKLEARVVALEKKLK